MKLKPFARYVYGNVPGAAALRFAVKDIMASRVRKPEFDAVTEFDIGDGLIIDVGANRGQSIAAFKALSPRSRVIAFEPEPRSARQLEARYSKDRSVEIKTCALGDKLDTITFFVPSYGYWNCDGMAATTYVEATAWLDDPTRMFRFDKRKLSVKEESVALRTLDSYELHPCLLKLHAQGAELAILLGAKETVLKHCPLLMCAFAKSEVTAILGEWGYSPYSYVGSRFQSGVSDARFTFTWFLTPSHLAQLRDQKWKV